MESFAGLDRAICNQMAEACLEARRTRSLPVISGYGVGAALLAADGMLVKRPILVGEDFVLVGFREKEWAQQLGFSD